MKNNRTLKAIMFSDIVGFTQLTGDDESLSIKLLEQNSIRHKKLIADFNGHWLKDIGDGTLATFDSAIDAANCAIAIQNETSLERKYQLRIALHLGDVLASSNDIIGNSVNITARIQGVAEPGSIAISEMFFGAINGQPQIKTKLLGSKSLKGITTPLTLFAIIFDEESQLNIETNKPAIDSKKNIGIELFSLTLLLAFMVFAYQYYQNQQAVDQDDNLYSIAVLPFEDFTKNQDQSYFGNGLSEELLNVLAKIEGLNVASRTSSFATNLVDKNIQDIGKKLGVSHVLEGSIRRSNNTIRITAQLIKSDDGYHLWSQTYDRELKDIFLVQDEIAKSVATSLKKYLVTEVPHPESFESYDIYLKGLGYLHSPQNKENIELAIRQFKQVITDEPKYSSAYGALCQAYVNKYMLNLKNENIIDATDTCFKALELDNTQLQTLLALGMFRNATGKYDAALDSFNKALAINHLNVDLLLAKAETLTNQEKWVLAEQEYIKAIELSGSYWRGYNGLGTLYLLKSDFNSAIHQFKRVIELSPQNNWGYENLAICYYYLDDTTNAIKFWNKALEFSPDHITYSNLGALHFNLHDFSQAKYMFQKAIEYAPDVSIYQGNLADTYYFSNQPELAVKAYKAAINKALVNLAINDQRTETLATLAVYYARISQPFKAEDTIKQALELSSSDPYILYYAALTFLQIGKKEQGFYYLEQAITNGYPTVLIKRAPEFDTFQNNQIFKHLLEKEFIQQT